MSEEVEAQAEADKGWEIVVNGDEREVPRSKVTWDEVVDIAYPGEREQPDKIFRVDYEDANGNPKSGPLVEGEHVEVKHRGTEFSVIRSVRS